MKLLTTFKHSNRVFKTSSIAKTFAVILPLLACSPSFAGKTKDGPVTTGGGNSMSARILELQKQFGANDEGVTDQTMNKIILEMVQTLKKFPPKETVAMKNIKKMIEGGLEKDVMDTRYVLSSYCSVIDERTGKEVEKSASTQKINLIENPNQPSPDVCINVQELAANNASLDEIKGMLFHEHARHFGIEDTTPLKVNPIAVEISKMAKSIERTKNDWKTFYSTVGSSGTKIETYLKGSMTTENSPDRIYVNTTTPEKISFALKDVNPECNYGGFKINHQVTSDFTDLDGNRYFSVRYQNRDIVGPLSNINNYVQLNESEIEASYNTAERNFTVKNGNYNFSDKSYYPILIQLQGWNERPAKSALERFRLGDKVITPVACKGVLEIGLQGTVLKSYNVEFKKLSSYAYYDKDLFELIVHGIKDFSYTYNQD